MSSFPSAYTSLPSLYPSRCLTTFVALFPPSFPLSHPIHSAQHPSPFCPPNSLFLFDLPSLQGWLLPKRAEQRGTWLRLRHSHFQCHKFQFPIFLLLFSLLQPPSSPFSHGYTHHGNLSILFLCLFSLIHSDSLSPNTYWLLSCLTSAPDFFFCHTECNFPPAASVMRSKWKIINILFREKWSCVSYFKYCYFPSPCSSAIETLLSPLAHQGDADDHFSPVALPQLWWMHVCAPVKASENPTGIQKDICSLSLQKVFNLETLTAADEAAVIAVVSDKMERHH